MDALRQIAEECVEAWGLTLERPLESEASLVIPAGDAVLKVNADWHFEAEFEADALALWDGRGAVRLLARDDERRALLIERCRPGRRLWDAGDEEIDVVSSLLPRLELEPTRAAPVPDGRGRGRPLAGGAATAVSAQPPARCRARRVPYRGPGCKTSCQPGPAWRERPRAEREPWLVIDPKPLVGEREIDGVGLLRNADDPARWLDALTELGYDRERSWGWGFAHALAWDDAEKAERIYAARG